MTDNLVVKLVEKSNEGSSQWSIYIKNEKGEKPEPWRAQLLKLFVEEIDPSGLHADYKPLEQQKDIGAVNLYIDKLTGLLDEELKKYKSKEEKRNLPPTEPITLESVVSAMEAAKSKDKDYEPLRRSFEQDYEDTSLYVARAYVDYPVTFNLTQDARKGGFLENTINVVLDNHPQADATKYHLAYMLSIVAPNRFVFGIESAVYSFVYALGPLFWTEERALKAAEWVTYNLFDRFREPKYQALFLK